MRAALVIKIADLCGGLVMRIFLMAIILALPSAAIAKPVSLKCEIENSTGGLLFNLFEDEGKATYTSPASTQTKKAMFTPETVTILASQGQYLEIIFRISRVDLTIERLVKAGNEPPNIDKGICKIYQPPKRVF